MADPDFHDVTTENITAIGKDIIAELRKIMSLPKVGTGAAASVNKQVQDHIRRLFHGVAVRLSDDLRIMPKVGVALSTHSPSMPTYGRKRPANPFNFYQPNAEAIKAVLIPVIGTDKARRNAPAVEAAWKEFSRALTYFSDDLDYAERAALGIVTCPTGATSHPHVTEYMRENPDWVRKLRKELEGTPNDSEEELRRRIVKRLSDAETSPVVNDPTEAKRRLNYYATDAEKAVTALVRVLKKVVTSNPLRVQSHEKRGLKSIRVASVPSVQVIGGLRVITPEDIYPGEWRSVATDIRDAVSMLTRRGFAFLTKKITLRVRIDSDEFRAWPSAKDGSPAGASGLYYPEQPRQATGAPGHGVTDIIMTGQTGQGRILTVIHELAHHYYFAFLSPKARAVHERAFRIASSFPSEYGKSNAAEDFAESITAWVLRPMPARYRMNADIMARLRATLEADPRTADSAIKMHESSLPIRGTLMTTDLVHELMAYACGHVPLDEMERKLFSEKIAPEFDERKHKRADDGKFATKPGSGGATAEKPARRFEPEDDEAPKQRGAKPSKKAGKPKPGANRVKKDPKAKPGKSSKLGKADKAVKSGKVAKPGEEGAEAGEKKPKKGPGAQLPDDVREKLMHVGVSKLPPLDVPMEKIRVLGFGDEGPVLAWRDKRGKLQQAYSAAFLARNADKKWGLVSQLEPRFNDLRASVFGGLQESKPGTPEYEGAIVATIIALTGLRPGNPSSAKGLDHYGVSTLMAKHVSIKGDKAQLKFVGKAGKTNNVTIDEPTIVQALAQQLQGKEGKTPLFSPGARNAASALAGQSGYRLKDIRTVVASKAARKALETLAPPPPPLAPNRTEAKKQVARVLRDASTVVAGIIQNTPAMARSSYILPQIFEDWMRRVGFEG